jgi:Putative transposase, YhgA-like
MPGAARIHRCHDALVRHAFSRPEAIAIVLRRVLPPELLPHVDFRSLRPASTTHTSDWLLRCESDLHFIVDVFDAEARVPVHLPIEHQSTPGLRLPKRAHAYIGEIWDEYIREHPEDRNTLPFMLPILLTQYPARNTPTRLSDLLPVPPSLRGLLGTPVELTVLVDDFSGSVMDDLQAPLPIRALVEIARTLLHAYRNPEALTDPRIADLAPLFDILLEHNRPEDVRALWVYVISAFEASSPLRALIVQSVSKEAREMYITIEDELLAKGEAKGKAKGETKGRAQSLLGVLEHRAVIIPPPVRERVLATEDDSLLLRWFERAFTIAAADELFEPFEA